MKTLFIGVFCLQAIFLVSLNIQTVNTAGSSDPNVVVTETDPPRKLGFDSVVKVPKNRDAHFTCVVDNKPVAQDVQWMKLSPDSRLPVEVATDTETTDPFKYHIDKPSPLAWRLKIQNVQISDESVYICRVLISNQVYKKDSMQIIVTEIPEISDLETSSDESVIEGNPKKLTCGATGRPQPSIKWTKMAGGLLPEGGRELRDSVLEIKQASPHDRGRYKCEATNEAGSDSRLINVIVSFHPRITPDESIVRQKVGYLKELVCNIQGYPIPDDSEIVWSRDGPSMVLGRDYKITNIKGAASKKMSKLTIRNVQLHDFGKYQCSARNVHGRGEATIDLSESNVPTPDRTGQIRSGATMLSFGFVTCIMLVSVCFLHIF